MRNSRRNFVLGSAAVAAAGAIHAQVTQKPKPDIFEAAEAGDVPRATELLSADPELVHQRSSSGRTPLHHAAAAGKSAMVLYLGTAGADLSAGPESPLLAAVDYPDHDTAFEMSFFMLCNASDPKARRKDGKTALQLAAARGYADLTEMLIHRGAAITAHDVEIASGDAIKVLRRANEIERVHWDRRYIQDIHGKPVQRDDRNGLPWTLVNQCARVAHFSFDQVKQLHQEHPALLNTRATWDESAIEAASHMGLTEMAQWLADRGALVSTCTAVLLGLTDLVKDAVKQDSKSVCERGAHDIAILAYTAYGREKAEMADLLLKAGAKVDGKALSMSTLHIAAIKGQMDLATVLIGHGADVNEVVKTRGKMVTPLDLAIQAKQSKMEQLLKDKGARG
jgi:ankyrin repeat protein